MRKLLPALCLCGALAAAGGAHADITIGVTLSLTGPASALGIPLRNALQLWPAQIAGEKLNVIVLDDGGDATQATRNAQKLVTEDKVDAIVGSSVTPSTLAVTRVAQESETLQFACAPIEVPVDRTKWVFVIPQRVGLMSDAVVADMKARNIRTLGFIGFADPWGEVWMKELTRGLAGSQVKIVAEERYGRTDSSVAGQVLKLMAANPDAILVAASGTGAALPQIGLKERGYKGQIYHTHGAGSRDFIRIGGKATEGVILPIGPVLIGSELPDSHPSKKVVQEFVGLYEGKFGKGAPVVFGAHAYDVMLMLQRVVPIALKSAKPGTAAFRSALRDALESQREIAANNGVFSFSAADHFGLDARGRVLVRIEDGEWKVVK